MFELNCWRVTASLVLVGFFVVGACQQRQEPREIVLRSADGKREVRLTPDGLRFRESGRTTELTFGQLKLAAGHTIGEWSIQDGAASFVLQDKGPDREDRPFIRASFDTRRRIMNTTGKAVSGIVVKAGDEGWGSKTIIHASEGGGYLSIQDGRDKLTTIFPALRQAQK